MFYKLLVFLSLIYDLHAKIQQDCEIPVSSDYERNLPILLESNGKQYDFIIPNGPNVTIQNGNNLYVACPGIKNYFIKTNANLTTLTCNKRRLLIGNTQIQTNELQCMKLIKGSVRLSNKKCANGNGYYIDIGYELDKIGNFLPLITTCYSNETGNTFYAKHIMYSEVIKFASKTQHRPSFNVAGLGSKISPNVAYKRAFQKGIFNKLLRNTSLTERYITNTSYLSRGHLAPDSDFIFASMQFTTYFYINTNPQWQSVNGGNWRRLESLVRYHSMHYKDRITIYTGSYGILQLKDMFNKLIDIYMLPNNLLPVPKYFWKILHNPVKQEGIVFVNLNNPFASNDKNDIFCHDICKESGWQKTKFNATKSGLLFCCDYVEFAKIVQTIPKLNVANIMKRVKK